MKPDPTIDAIHQVRHQISASVNHDAKKLVEHYRELQKKYPNKIFSLDLDVRCALVKIIDQYRKVA